jgi:Kef-type K+ transport system membrane component KefB/nucleotide-binding universal stress UspA family protein
MTLSPSRLLAVGLPMAVACAAVAYGAADGGATIGGSAEAILVAQIVLLLLVGRGLGEILQRFGQPAVIGQLLAGLILGPSLFGWLMPHAHDLIFPKSAVQKSLISGISEVGILMLLLLTGMETDLRLARKVGKAAFAISATGVLVPFACGFLLGEVLPGSLLPDPAHRLIASLFLGTALSISSIKIVAVVVREMNFLRRNLGQIIVASSIMEDTAGWVIVSVALGLAGAGIALARVTGAVVGTMVFLVAAYTVGRTLVFRLIRWVNDTFASEYAVVTAILIVMCVMALVTQGIGVNMVLGAFVAGVLIGESPILSQQIEDELRGFITAFMMPIFFGLSGLSADLTVLKDPTLALVTLGLIAVASIGKFAGAYAGAMFSGLTASEALALGCAMNARGSTDVIVATIGLSMGALSQNLYTMIVAMAVLTTTAMPPALRWALGRLPMRPDEKERLQREEISAKGFVSQFERLLIVADDSESGKFASRMAGFIAGQRGMPITVVKIEGRRRQPGDAATLKAAATEGAKDGHRSATAAEQGDARPHRVEVTERAEQKLDVAVSSEAHKGYDILFVGTARMHNQDGSFSRDVDRVLSGYEGPFVLAISGEDSGPLHGEGLNILVPVDGTDVARRSAEVAFAISPPSSSKVTALHVAERASGERTSIRRKAKNNIERAVLDDVAALARRYGYDEIQMAVHVKPTPDAAILEEARRSGADVIVLGASRRVGEEVYLGRTVAHILQKWPGAVVLVVS